jgi:hypothetical protein
MASFSHDMDEFRERLKEGSIQKAYRGLMDFFQGLRTRFQREHPDWEVSGSVYYGFMDMTYFGLFPKEMKERKLKIAVVFLYDEFRFDAWLSGGNRQVQEKYWRKIKETGWDRHRVVPVIEGSDSIVECELARDPDFSDLEGLARRIEKGVATFVEDMGELLETLGTRERDSDRSR